MLTTPALVPSLSVDAPAVAERLEALADELIEAGSLRSPEWRRAFLQVHRHVFVPRFWRDETPGQFPGHWRMLDRATADRQQWLDAVYSNTTLATDLTAVPLRDGSGVYAQVTSSTTMPGLVLAMLEDLDVADGMTVLEIGTGTGYNAGLLCERLGAEHVTSIDIAPELVALARVRLAEHGYKPHLIAGDGALGAPQGAPWDRIIATCGLDEVPRAWIEQTRAGGKILLNLLGPFNMFALVLLTVAGGRASGRFLRQSGGFMPRRANPVDPHNYAVAITAPEHGITDQHGDLDPTLLYSDSTWGLLAQTALPGVVSRQIYVDDDEHLATELFSAADGAWALVHHDRDEAGHLVRQAGPRRIWDDLTALHQHWDGEGQPSYDRFGIAIDATTAETTSTDTTTTLWLDEPDGPQWELHGRGRATAPSQR
ncbi:MAG: methyltransferase domain-containing protein [Pseudonocardia sp.]